MSSVPDDARTKNEQLVIEAIARNLGIRPEDLLQDPTFRKEVGAEEIDRLENRILREQEAE
jgi:hypothetical protein